MELLDYLKTMSSEAQADFAVAVGTTYPHLRNVAYKQRIASAALARQIAERSAGQVPLNILRPVDWHLIWGKDLNHLVEERAIVIEPAVVTTSSGVTQQLPNQSSSEGAVLDVERSA